MVGQAALEKRRILLTDVPVDYVKVPAPVWANRSPVNIVVLPVLFEGVKAVMEAFRQPDRFNSTHQAFLDQLTESIGIVLNTIEANTRAQATFWKRVPISRDRTAKRSAGIAEDQPGAAGKSALQSRERSVPRHAEPRIADAAYTGDRFHPGTRG